MARIEVRQKEGDAKKKKVVSANLIHYTVRRKLIKEQQERLFPYPTGELLDKYFEEFWRLVEDLIKKGYGIRFTNLFALSIKVDSNNLLPNAEKPKVRGYLRVSKNLKRQIMAVKAGKRKVKPIIIYNRATGEKLEL